MTRVNVMWLFFHVVLGCFHLGKRYEIRKGGAPPGRPRSPEIPPVTQPRLRAVVAWALPWGVEWGRCLNALNHSVRGFGLTASQEPKPQSKDSHCVAATSTACLSEKPRPG